MKTFLRSGLVRAVLLPGICLGWFAASAGAQPNSWTNPAGGRWEDPQWSLGVLPGTNQDVWFTNAGSKTLVIGADTTRNFPGALTMHNLFIAGSDTSTNTLLLDHAGPETSLNVTDLFTSGRNSAVLARNSSLQFQFASINGTFTQS